MFPAYTVEGRNLDVDNDFDCPSRVRQKLSKEYKEENCKVTVIHLPEY